LDASGASSPPELALDDELDPLLDELDELDDGGSTSLGALE